MEKYKVTIEYYCTVKDIVSVEAESKSDAIRLVENGIFEQIMPQQEVEIDWDSIIAEKVEVFDDTE